jgi:hypothetical protein
MSRTSIIDDTHLPAHIPGILAKAPADRTPIEQAALDAYNKKLGPGGAEMVGRVAETEEAAPQAAEPEVKKPVNKV